jgi:DNA sulfur modification protein DndB
MKIPAIRAKIGDWTYYVTTLSFEQVNQFVSKVDHELHQSESLNELIQRSITQNYINIKEYIINQRELFFNALVLAVYNDYPNWREIEFKYGEEETYQMGLLEFPGTHKIFPVDGQHRVEGIKAALRENPELATQRIAAIFIGHKNDAEGMRRSRRLFSTLNRYAKPVTMDDIIALDEDDSVAILTRELLESFDLFTQNRVTKSNNKAILDTDKESFTSIITLYQCNKEFLRLYLSRTSNTEVYSTVGNPKILKYLMFRPNEEALNSYINYCIDIWSAFKENFDCIQDFLITENEQAAYQFRNKDIGGNLLFRPIGLLPLIQASIEIKKRTGMNFSEIFERLNQMELIISAPPWKNVVWNPNERTMIMTPPVIIKLILLYMFGKNVITATEITALKKKYADKVSSDDIQNVLDRIPILP